jgi:hypothetical protein
MPNGNKDDQYDESPNDSRSFVQVDAAATTSGERPRTYADRRLLEMARAVGTITVWMSMFCIVIVLGVIPY